MLGTVIILAKAPRAGFSKTRLTPPLNPREAAELAEAALIDTVAAVLGVAADSHVLCLEGEQPPWLPAEVKVICQRGDTLADRLDAAFMDVQGPAFLVAMDTPQVTSAQIAAALSLVSCLGHRSTLGLTTDGGYWGIGLRDRPPGVFGGIPMSSADTGRLQKERLVSLGAPPAMLPELRDVDFFEDALEVAALDPRLRFSSKVRAFASSLAHTG